MSRKRFRFDWVILAIVAFLTIISLLTLSGIDKEIFTNQLVNVIVGLVAFFFFAFFPYKNLQKVVWPMAGVCLILLVLPMLLGAIVRGASRWIDIGGFSLQPSEVIKPFVILFLSAQTNPIISLTAIWPFFALVFLQPDLGSSLVLLSGWVGINFHQKKTRRYIMMIILAGLLLLPLIWLLLADFQKSRVTSFLNPGDDPLGSSYQSLQAIITAGSGRLIGRGLGLGSQSRLAFLPERHNDLLFASFVEAFGFLGGASLIAAYFILFWRLFSLAEEINNHFGQNFIIGVTVMLAFQTIINIGMNLGVLPITGLTLPLFSYGGSSYLSTMICLGIVEAIYRQRTISRLPEWHIH